MKNFEKTALLIVALALAWPPIHMIASSKEMFSAWRFFGWGMYSEISPVENKKLIIADPDSIAREELLGCSSHIREVMYCSLKVDEKIKERIVDDLVLDNDFTSAFRRFAFFNRIDRMRYLLVKNEIEGFDLAQHKLAMGKIQINELSDTMQLDWSIIGEDNP